MHIDLDYIYDENRQQMDRNIDVLIQRVKDMQISTVYLQAFADPDGDGLVKEVWFPNRLLPMKADIFSRVAWQLRTRSGVKHLCVDAGIKLGFRSHINASKILYQLGRKKHKFILNNTAVSLLSMTGVRAQVGMLYDDLAGHAAFDGILFHDDAFAFRL